MKWWQSVEQALMNLGGQAHLTDIYNEVTRTRNSQKLSIPESLKAITRKELEYNSSDSSNWTKKRNIFYSVNGIGSGVWGLRDSLPKTPIANDIQITGKNELPSRIETTIYRILRDTELTRKLKLLHQHKCQLCGNSINLSLNTNYSEAHHVKPLGHPHDGPDIASNILILCPNHHVELDYGAIKLNIDQLNQVNGHTLSKEYISYHNSEIYRH